MLFQRWLNLLPAKKELPPLSLSLCLFLLEYVLMSALCYVVVTEQARTPRTIAMAVIPAGERSERLAQRNHGDPITDFEMYYFCR